MKKLKIIIISILIALVATGMPAAIKLIIMPQEQLNKIKFPILELVASIPALFVLTATIILALIFAVVSIVAFFQWLFDLK